MVEIPPHRTHTQPENHESSRVQCGWGAHNTHVGACLSELTLKPRVTFFQGCPLPPLSYRLAVVRTRESIPVGGGGAAHGAAACEVVTQHVRGTLPGDGN